MSNYFSESKLPVYQQTGIAQAESILLNLESELKAEYRKAELSHQRAVIDMGEGIVPPYIEERKRAYMEKVKDRLGNVEKALSLLISIPEEGAVFVDGLPRDYSYKYMMGYIAQYGEFVNTSSPADMKVCYPPGYKLTNRETGEVQITDTDKFCVMVEFDVEPYEKRTTWKKI